MFIPQSCPTLCDPLDCSSRAPPWNSPGKNTGVGSHSLLQGIEPGSPALQADSLLSEPPEKPINWSCLKNMLTDKYSYLGL